MQAINSFSPLNTFPTFQKPALPQNSFTTAPANFNTSNDFMMSAFAGILMDALSQLFQMGQNTNIMPPDAPPGQGVPDVNIMPPDAPPGPEVTVVPAPASPSPKAKSNVETGGQTKPEPQVNVITNPIISFGDQDNGSQAPAKTNTQSNVITNPGFTFGDQDNNGSQAPAKKNTNGNVIINPGISFGDQDNGVQNQGQDGNNSNGFHHFQSDNGQNDDGAGTIGGKSD